MRALLSVLILSAGLTLSGHSASADDFSFRYEPWLGHGESYRQGNEFNYGLGQKHGNYNGATLFYPSYGLVCDTRRRACYNGNRYDRKATRYYFGGSGKKSDKYSDPARVIDPNWSNGGNGLYSPKAGIQCDSVSRTCADKRGMDAHWTGRVFGDSYEDRVEDWRASDGFRPRPGIVCDNRRRVCASSRGVERGLTRFYYGRSAGTQPGIYVNPFPLFGGETYKPGLYIE